MESVILKVVLVLGIVIAGGFLLFFMADILMAIFNGKKDEKVIKVNQEKDSKHAGEKLSQAGYGEISNAVVNGAVVENYETESVEEEDATPVDEIEEVEEEEEEEEKKEEQDDAESRIEARRRALMERLARMNEESEEEEEEEETEESQEEEETEESSEEEAEEETEEEVVNLDEAEEEKEDVTSEELEDARKALEEERAKTEALRAELEETRKQIIKEAEEPVYLTEEEYEARLAVLNERLKLNEKELRACKKEYIPLRRVKKSLDSDEKKLRRKEALVAKQKVVLYGVNNYEDIDEEKAQKLAEDLDHLDGLKLSVEHCREVMEKNKERYPLLERIYTVLSEQNATLKADIARAEIELAEVRAKKNK